MSNTFVSMKRPRFNASREFSIKAFLCLIEFFPSRTFYLDKKNEIHGIEILVFRKFFSLTLGNEIKVPFFQCLHFDNAVEMTKKTRSQSLLQRCFFGVFEITSSNSRFSFSFVWYGNIIELKCHRQLIHCSRLFQHK